ncbi:MAG: lipid-A-disaccharide synthase [Sulfurimonas sp. RIFCSPHIGHO2_12_FULL_36_9]|uniref:lipid-A-disaccharide synthase n=1 Tax=Sulfurimonas sp. RIFCSPLOWO2_12_36_12 TaxID=1802253 RepID=UPI0008B27037|nr:lipid-A-disaccharide synthase [Sulfurimonas sp. RIFCSPLOWO2_12_36_12]OHD98453.1 MAG: lipid-A-disaccharide synthase [Sulfurimonas sp. RIFCSPHIGHO2_12_FULL_36_9]OHE00577.1 MAG: lipid-A-disaccharide synthase [Sulfurimonas sp. RIFCSPLOWO2_02_FULL_36_28]OHE00755.1 MAG: lipid-A-disaccharide synthase [Sulfurimonas sp. RIFCSPLOWO2_12_36_12]OHE08216.1 MAG: lipid-A-disaccharide synthase [Sulfurimonas sp. RIFCSPLOWO2_12_FULL_36_74]
MKILVSALEHSANIHLKSLKKELSETTEFIGIFDRELGSSIIDLRSLAIMGFVDAIKKLRFFIKLNNQMLELAKDVDKVLLIDSSGFNLPLAKKIRKKYPNKEIIYYILPQAWAWKKKRIPVLERTIDHLASILPFEKEYYSKNAPITYVGHPLLDQITEFKESLNSEVKQIAFMPGSRKGEIKKLIPIFKEVQKELGIESTIIIPKHFSKEDIKELYGSLSGFKIAHDAHKTLLEADFAFICSGTATLEASLIGIPFILTYIARPLDYFIASRLVKLDYIGLGNIMFSKFQNRALHPEFIQEDVSAKNLLRAYSEYDRSRFLEGSKALRAYLKHGSSKTVAKIIEGIDED